MKPHQNKDTQTRFIYSVAFTGTIFLAELIGGIWTGSLALLSDSAHVFMDLFALVLSLLAVRISSRPADDRHTYGFHRYEVLAALINGISLGIIALGIFYEAIQRWQSPVEIRGTYMLIIAAVGLMVNILVAIILGRDEHVHDNGRVHVDLNVRSAFLHVIGDAVSSVGVIIAAVLIQWTHALWLDAAVSVLIGLMILAGSYRVVRSAVHILIEGVPEGIAIDEVSNSMMGVEGIDSIHDLHVWNICSGHIALSAHIVSHQRRSADDDTKRQRLNSVLAEKFRINHTTLQFESIACEEENCC
jgi:cobalt-zinc-cadmium efflux system protein